MKATEQLMKEHEAVTLMLQILGSVRQKLLLGENVPVSDLEAMLDFLHTFVDKCHHGKEENLLFPKLVETGIPNEGGPVGVMLADHFQGRAYIKGFADGVALYKTGDPAGIVKITDNIEGYCDLLTSHIFKENNILFRMADMHLGDEDQKDLLEKFEELEENIIGKGKHEEYHRLLERLSSIYHQ